MKNIRLKTNCIQKGSHDYVGDYLKSLGIAAENIFSFINMPRKTDKDNPKLLNNVEEAVETAYQMLTKKKDIHVYVQPDPDTDGFTSSAVLISYLNRRFPSAVIHWKLHEGKDHGIVPSFVDDSDELVFIPDAGSNDYNQQKELIAKGKTVIILDHHEVENYQDTGAILVNNQFSPLFTNKYLSGVGIVYMFISLMDEKYFSTDKIADDYLDLTAVGIIADAMNMTTLGNNYIAYYGLSHIKNNFLKELIIKQERGIKDPNWLSKIDVAFYIAPVINGVIRSGSQEEKELVFRAMVTNESNEIFESEWRGVQRRENLWHYAARIAANAKSRQDAAKKKGFEMIVSLIKTYHWDDSNLIIATLDSKLSAKINPNFTGLIAMELVKEFNRPCLVLRETTFEGQHIYGGSGRNGSFFGLPDLMSFCQNSNLLTYSAGHANAFGIFINPDNVQKLRDYSNKALDSSIFTNDITLVDYWFRGDKEGESAIDLEMLTQFAEADKIYGNSIPEPKFAFTFPYGMGSYRVMGKNQDTVKLSYGGVDFIAFRNTQLAHELGAKKGGTITLIGEPQINEWNGHKTIQIKINEIEVLEKGEPTPEVIEATTQEEVPSSINWDDLL